MALYSRLVLYVFSGYQEPSRLNDSPFIAYGSVIGWAVIHSGTVVGDVIVDVVIIRLWEVEVVWTVVFWIEIEVIILVVEACSVATVPKVDLGVDVVFTYIGSGVVADIIVRGGSRLVITSVNEVSCKVVVESHMADNSIVEVVLTIVFIGVNSVVEVIVVLFGVVLG